jgi:hypothetical protein
VGKSPTSSSFLTWSLQTSKLTFESLVLAAALGSSICAGLSARFTNTSERARQLTTILRQFARKLAESADASERKIGLKNADAAKKIAYFLRFVRILGFERRLLRM